MNIHVGRRSATVVHIFVACSIYMKATCKVAAFDITAFDVPRYGKVDLAHSKGEEVLESFINC